MCSDKKLCLELLYKGKLCGRAGGRDTAGLGGKGGPYRLDAGHKVYQISQAEKDAVPEEVKRASREMAEKAFKERYAHSSLSVHILLPSYSKRIFERNVSDEVRSS